MKAGFMSKVFYVFPIAAFAVFALMVIGFNSNRTLKDHDKKNREIIHIEVRNNSDKSNF